MSGENTPGAPAWIDPDDAPELDEDFFRRAEIRDGARLIAPAIPPGAPARPRRGPPLKTPRPGTAPR